MDADGRAELESQTGRLVERLRTMALDRLTVPYAPEPTRVEAARRLAQRLADAAAALEQPSGPVWREVPQVSAAGAGDLVAVTSHDLLVAAEGVAGSARVVLQDREAVRLDELLAELADAARELRLRL